MNPPFLGCGSHEELHPANVYRQFGEEGEACME